MTKQQSKQSATYKTSDKTSPNQTLVQLTEAQLEEINGGIGSGGGGDCSGTQGCPTNHNETMVNASQPHKAETSTSDKTRLQVLNLEQLEAVSGGPMAIIRKEG